MSDFSCHCEVFEGDDEYWSAYWESTPKARKEHVCCECQGIIKPGEIYHRFSGVCEGGIEVYKICSWCWKMHGEMEDKLKMQIPFGELACAYNQFLREQEGR